MIAIEELILHKVQIIFLSYHLSLSLSLPLSYCLFIKLEENLGCVPVGRRACPFVFSYLDKEEREGPIHIIVQNSKKVFS